jgi:hypothetical protein
VPCPNCRTRQLVVIDMQVSGEDIRMASCSSCDARWWQGADGFLPLTDVLSLAAAGR